MSNEHPQNISPPATIDDTYTHKRIFCENISVRSPGAKESVSLFSYPGAAGVFVQSGNGNESIGLCTQQGMGPFLIIWEGSHNFPPNLAITGQGLQIPDAQSSDKVTVLSFADLLKAIKQVRGEKAE